MIIGALRPSYRKGSQIITRQETWICAGCGSTFKEADFCIEQRCKPCWKEHNNIIDVPLEV